MNISTISLEDLTIVVYCAIDDALSKIGVKPEQGKLIPRRGPPPEVDDREILCLSVIQELLGFESDHKYYLYLKTNSTMRSLFPRILSRPNFAERRALLLPLIQQLCSAFCELEGETNPPFSSLTHIL